MSDTITQKEDTAQLAMLLACARPDIRAKFTADWLVKRYNVPRGIVTHMLDEANQLNLDGVKFDRRKVGR